MRENARQEQGYHTKEEVYRGVVYNPHQLPTSYGAGEYNHQVFKSICTPPRVRLYLHRRRVHLE